MLLSSLVLWWYYIFWMTMKMLKVRNKLCLSYWVHILDVSKDRYREELLKSSHMVSFKKLIHESFAKISLDWIHGV